MNSGRFILLCWFVAAAWRAQRGRWVVATASVAVGIALAAAIHTVNQSALDSFQQAVAAVNGDAQLQVVARAGYFDETIFEAVLAGGPAAGVAAASPVVEVDVRVETRSDESSEGRQARRDQRLNVLGVDVFRAAVATPGLLPLVDGDGASGGSGSDLFADDAIFLSPAAQAWFGVRAGQMIALRAGLERVRLRVAGSVTAPAGQRLALMDIGSAQWRLGVLGKLTRIDLKLEAGVMPAQAAAALRALLPPTVDVLPPVVRQQRMRSRNAGPGHRPGQSPGQSGRERRQPSRRKHRRRVPALYQQSPGLAAQSRPFRTPVSDRNAQARADERAG